MNKTQKILATVIIFGLCASIALSIYLIRTTPRFGKLSTIHGEPYNPNTPINNDYPVTPPIEKKYVSLSITPPIEVDISNWKEFKDDKYGVTVKYPKDWTLKTSISTTTLESGILIKSSHIYLHKNDHIISIDYGNDNLNIPTGGRVISNISDYISFPAINTVITRSIVPDQWEGNGQTYLYVCHIQTDANNKVLEGGASCDESTIINKVDIGISYALDTGKTFDPNILKEMDAILQHISVK